MEQLIANIAGKTRREELNGREHIVAPLTLIVPGVLNGSQGPLYYPQDEINKNPSVWNNIPIVLGHPNMDGQHISARDPDVLNTVGIGAVMRASANGKLIAEGWFDVEATRRIDNRVLQALEEGKPVELSTGLFTRNEPAEEGATFNGTAYSATARNYQPDHLAILPDTKGACSLEDGCGVMVNKSNTNKDTAMDLNEKEKGVIVDSLIANCDCWIEEDREILNSFSNKKLEELTKNTEKVKNREAVHNAAILGFEDQQGNSHTFNKGKQKWETKVKEELMINETSVKEIKPQTPEEWLANSPPEIQAVVQNSLRKEAEDRKNMIENLSSENSTKEWLDLLNGSSTNHLEVLTNNLPEKKKEEVTPIANYYGQSVPTGNQVDELDQEDMLVMPVLDYTEQSV